MTVAELGERISSEELTHWSAWFDMQAKAERAAMDAAKKST